MASADLGLRRRAETAFRLDEADKAVETFALPQIGHDEGPFAAHPSRIGSHLFQRRADMRREVDLVDDEEIRPRDPGAALGRDLVARRDVDAVNPAIRELTRERGAP